MTHCIRTQKLLLQLLRSRHHLRRVVLVIYELPDRSVEALAQRMVLVATLFVECSLDSLHHLPENLVIDGSGDPPRRLCFDPAANDVLILRDCLCSKRDGFIEQLLMPVPLRHQRQSPADERCDARRVNAVENRSVDHRLNVVIPHRFGRRDKSARSVPRHCFAVGGIAEKLRQPLAESRSDQPGLDDVATHEVPLDERTEYLSYPILSRRDDRSVRYRYPHRMPEQGSHCKPIGQSAHHRRFRKGLNPAKPGITRAQVVRDPEGHSRENEQASRTHFHVVQLLRAYPLVECGKRYRLVHRDRQRESLVSSVSSIEEFYHARPGSTRPLTFPPATSSQQAHPDPTHVTHPRFTVGTEFHGHCRGAGLLRRFVRHHTLRRSASRIAS